MSCLCQGIKESQRNAAALTDGELKSAIETNLDILDVAIDQLARLCVTPPLPSEGADLEHAAAIELVLMAALEAALHTAELTRRPVKHTAYVQTNFSAN
jgi:hypothetical protein